jgi:hypothetical protein
MSIISRTIGTGESVSPSGLKRQVLAAQSQFDSLLALTPEQRANKVVCFDAAGGIALLAMELIYTITAYTDPFWTPYTDPDGDYYTPA